MTEKKPEPQGPSMGVGRGHVLFNGKRMRGVYMCKSHDARLIFAKGALTINNVTWKADPKNGYWIACCRQCRRVLKDPRSKRFVCPIEDPNPPEKKEAVEVVEGD